MNGEGVKRESHRPKEIERDRDRDRYTVCACMDRLRNEVDKRGKLMRLRRNVPEIGEEDRSPIKV